MRVRRRCSAGLPVDHWNHLMHFFLDTNVFYNDWFFRSASFRYLFHFINNKGHELLMSKLVVEEAKNIQARELALAVAAVKKNLENAEKLNGGPVFPEVPVFEVQPYEPLSILKGKVEH